MNSDGSAKINFPITFNLKVIMERTESDDATRILLENLLLRMNILFTAWETKGNPESRYVRFSVTVTLHSRDEMNLLYQELEREPTVRAAI